MDEPKAPYLFERIVRPSVEGSPRNGEGDVVALADGRLLLVYGEFYDFGDAAPATLQGMFSPDGGRTWTGKHLVQENIGGMNVMSVSLHRLTSGDILLLFLRKDETRAWCTPFLRRSGDEGKTWSPPTPITPVTSRYRVVNNDRIVRLRGGRVLVPAFIREDGRPMGDIVFRSDDDGRTWSGSPLHLFPPESKSGPQEPGVIELHDDRIMMWCRCDLGQIYRCYSADGGVTFGPWEPMGLKAPVAPSAVKRLPSTGDLLCVFNNHEVPPDYWAMTRSPLTAALSSDDGRTWRVAGDLEPDRTHSYCYASVGFLPNREILLTYYTGGFVDVVEDGRLIRRQRNLLNLKVAALAEDWLYGRSGQKT